MLDWEQDLPVVSRFMNINKSLFIPQKTSKEIRNYYSLFSDFCFPGLEQSKQLAKNTR
jgi:hypothetical protein